MATRLLIIHRQLVFAVTLKQALEQTGGFAVHPFTKADAAFDFLRDHPQDIALIDFNLPGRSGTRIVQQLRTIQPDLAIIATPRQDATETTDLNLQGMIDMPFGARDLIPVLHNAVDQVQLGEPPLDPDDTGQFRVDPLIRSKSGQVTTSSLGSPQSVLRKQFGTTEHLSAESPENYGESRLAQSSLGEHQTPGQPTDDSSSSTHRLKKKEAPAGDTYPLESSVLPSEALHQRRATDRLQTHDLRDQPPAAADTPESQESDPAGTRPIPGKLPRLSEILGTQDLGLKTQHPDELRTQNLGGGVIHPLPPAETNRLPAREEDSATHPLPPSAPPGFTPLDQVLQSFGFEAVTDDQDTPNVPPQDSDALRQFLATSGQTDIPERFDNVLESIEPEAYPENKPKRQSDFEGLVRSMQSGEPHRTLPDRQQQMMDFILTTGMDSLVSEIQKQKTGPLTPPKQTRQKAPPQPPASLPEAENSVDTSSFNRLAKEEPPLPTLTENGTVSDLLVGIHDPGFRDVLAVLGGQSIEDTQQTPVSSPSNEDAEAKAFDDFFSYIDTHHRPEVSRPTLLPVAPHPDFGFSYEDEADDQPTVAQVVLETTLGKTSKPDAFSIDELISDIEDRLSTHQLRVRPLPSWELDTTAFNAVVDDSIPPRTAARIKEPDFLPEQFPPGEIIPPEMPPLETSEPIWTTHASPSTLEAMQTIPDDAETVMEAPRIEEPYESESLVIESPTATEDRSEAPAWTWDTFEPVGYPDIEQQVVEMTAPFPEPSEEVFDGDFASEMESPAAVEFAPVEAELVEEVLPSEPVVLNEEARIAQLALNLTQASLELSADGTILTRNNEVIAAAGDLSTEDVIELRDLIRNDWEASPEGARLRFITLPSSGKEYMLYSIQTDSELVLSMIFSGTISLRSIRQQGQKLAKALSTVPEPATALSEPLKRSSAVSARPGESAITKSLAETLEPYTYVWLVRDPNRKLTGAVKQAITAGLSTQLREMRWEISTLDVTEDYVYLLADVPGEAPSFSVIRDLKQRAAEIASTLDQGLAPQRLWADSYLVLTPGRQLDEGEIQEFINFQRML
jgi:DNA-binding response OmpR family regulator/REP element-mobilizing transposase RayT